jgi:hypothetical protein
LRLPPVFTVTCSRPVLSFAMSVLLAWDEPQPL